ncbi:MAG TPA: glycosyltransferase [Opitutae bacterium]|nr:glycosyltransferase [Opitutae bacterium]|tara:strand:- start:935 stop:1738 length:804 start_codon:yes stop_codon:yes gene_type:complete
MAGTKPILSILTPVYNGEAFIEGCLRSVIDQHCSAAEHIICDGHSSDQTCQIIERYAQEFPHIRLSSQKDTGQSEAMNRAVRLARGPIIGFLNVDDYYEPGVLNTLCKLQEDAPDPTLFMGNCTMRDAQDAVIGINKPEARSQMDIIKGKSFSYNPSAYFYHKSLHDLAGYYDEGEHYVMDLDFLLRIIDLANIEYHDALWGNFRFMEGGKTFGDAQDGTLWRRCDTLFQKYLKRRSLKDRCEVALYRSNTQTKQRLQRLFHRLWPN